MNNLQAHIHTSLVAAVTWGGMATALSPIM